MIIDNNIYITILSMMLNTKILIFFFNSIISLTLHRYRKKTNNMNNNMNKNNNIENNTKNNNFIKK